MLHRVIGRSLLRIALLSILVGALPSAPMPLALAKPAIVDPPAPALAAVPPSPSSILSARTTHADAAPAIPAPKQQTTAPAPPTGSAAATPPSTASVPAAKLTPAATPVRTPGFGPFPLAFVANAGQSDAAVRFLVRSRGGTFFFTMAGAVLAVPILDPNAPIVNRGRHDGRLPRVAGTTVLRLQYQGVNSARELRAGQRLLGVVNYLVGSDPSQWHTNLPTYDSVSYAQLYT